jgi:hypothetical protein
MMSRPANPAERLLSALFDKPSNQYISGAELAKDTALDSTDLNFAAVELVDAGLARWTQPMGTAPYEFGGMLLTARGRYEAKRLRQRIHNAPARSNQSAVPTGLLDSIGDGIRPPLPVGSPYGFGDGHWEAIALRRSHGEILYVVMGHQFESSHYDTERLIANVRRTVEQAVERHNRRSKQTPIALDFKPLAAGYGEHLFNEIACNIIGSDIAIFETSDQNPNVMLEMGVALTWGVRVLPIKKSGLPEPPSDISGQTWADYGDSGEAFPDPDHVEKLVHMIARAMTKKTRTY